MSPKPGEVLWQERFTDVLNHADADDLVVLLVVLHVAVVRDLYAASIIQPGFL